MGLPFIITDVLLREIIQAAAFRLLVWKTILRTERGPGNMYIIHRWFDLGTYCILDTHCQKYWDT